VPSVPVVVVATGASNGTTAPSSIDFERDTTDAFTRIRTTVVVRIDEDQIADGDRAEEAEVDGQVVLSSFTSSMKAL
jgi:hypothetical protein